MKFINKLTKKKRIILGIAAVALVAIAAELIRSNIFIDTQTVSYNSDNVQSDSIRIVQVSDFHNAGEWFEQRVVSEVKELSPDVIVITGDTVDSRLTDFEDAERLLVDLSELADCYLILGNHEQRLADSDIEKLSDMCTENGITLLDDKISIYENGENRLVFVGTSSSVGGGFDQTVSELEKLGEKSVIWLHHFPEDMELIAEQCERIGVSQCLMFSGHAHGGLVGLPSRNALYAPGQGLFPEYTGGEYKSDNGIVTMLLSRGVGNSGISRRMFNQPHIIVCDIE